MSDIRYAIRALVRQPVFTIVAVVTLALGLGANTAIFSLIYHTLLRPLPYPNADRLVFVFNSYPLMGLSQASVAIPDYVDRRTQAPAIEEAALYTKQNLNLTDGGRPERVGGLRVTPSLFATLQRTPALGRAFSNEEGTPGRDRVAILTHAFWRTRFGADRGAIGRSIQLDGAPYEIVGVLSADFELPSPDISLLVPFAFTPAQVSDQERGREFSSMVARLRPGATIEQVNAQMRTIVARNLDRLPNARAFARTSGFTAFAVDFREQLVGDFRAPLLLLQASVIVVLLIAGANVASLLLVRATGRSRELGIRIAMGAGLWPIVRQLLVESLVLSAAGLVAGLAVGLMGVRVMVALSPSQIAGVSGASLNLPVLAFTMALAVATGVMFGLVPALALRRTNLTELLNDDSARTSPGRGTGRTRATLVVAETALALMLLVGAGLLVKSFARLLEVDPGFKSDHVLTAQISLPASQYPDAGARAAFWTRLLDGVRRVPGVTSVGLTSNIPLSGNVSSGSYSILGLALGQNEARPHGRQEVAGGDYFGALRIPLVKGRLFSDLDTPTSEPVVAIDQYLVDRYFRDRDPIGQQIQSGGPTSPKFTIVGVVGTINAIDLGQPVNKERLYYPVTQAPQASMALLVRTAVEPGAVAAQVRTAVASIDAALPTYDVRSLDEWMARSLAPRRAPMLLLAIFGAVALLLSTIGIYGALAYSVAERARELAIRRALGADRRTILTLVLQRGLLTAGLGIVIGIVGAALLTRYLESQLFGVSPYDPVVLVVVSALLLAVATAACLVPALRATRIHPIAALREA
jgi:predicted permease